MGFYFLILIFARCFRNINRKRPSEQIMEYELFYLIGESREVDLEKIKKMVKKVVTDEGGSFSEEELEERRKLAYPIRHEKRGTYITSRFSLSVGEKETKTIDKIIRKLNLSGEILRFLIVKAENLPSLAKRKKTIEEREKEIGVKRIVAKKEKKEYEEKTKKEPMTIATEKPTPEIEEKETKKPESMDVDQKIKERKEKKEELSVAEKPEQKKEELSQDQDEIDKKLDEILNI